MKKALLLALALAVIPVGVDAQSPVADFWRDRAEKVDAQSQYLLGSMYADGENGLPEDHAEAVRWYLRSAEQGFALAQFNLWLMYAAGDGVPDDDVLAYMWFNLSAAQGTPGAQSNKDIIEQQMTSEQIAEAQRLSREWLDAHPPGGN